MFCETRRSAMSVMAFPDADQGANMHGLRHGRQCEETAMEPEDLEPRKKAVAPRELDSLSIEELKAYIGDLEGEIDRVKAKIQAKQAHLAGAASLFKTG
jgi:uncharacterized small protein (DUF1192 family)